MLLKFLEGLLFIKFALPSRPQNSKFSCSTLFYENLQVPIRRNGSCFTCLEDKTSRTEFQNKGILSKVIWIFILSLSFCRIEMTSVFLHGKVMLLKSECVLFVTWVPLENEACVKIPYHYLLQTSLQSIP